GPVEAGAPPGLLGCLQDERGHGGVVAVGVDAPETVLALLEEERERRERKRRAEPDELVGPPVDLRPEMLGVAAADDAVDPVGGEHEIRVGVGREISDLILELETVTERRADTVEY